MKICIYNEPFGGAIGGSEASAAVLASELSAAHEVEIVHFRPDMTRERLAEFVGVDLSKVAVRQLSPLLPQKGPAWRIASRLTAEKRQESAVSSGADIFIACVHEFPFFHTARIGILYVLFPIHDPAEPDSIDRQTTMKQARSQLRLRWREWKFRRRLAGYPVRLANSEFSSAWTKRRWKIDAAVVYPPVELSAATATAKEDLIVSVGRFAVGGHEKKQLEMLAAFAELGRDRASAWHYVTAGGCGDSVAEQALVAEARARAAQSRAQVQTNVTRAAVLDLYARAKIFWHAAGLGIDEERQPELAEHFGITTVEAMAAGCVPIVINRGGQREIVEHGVSGFLWNSVAELKDYTLQLMADDDLRQRMADAARQRSKKFSRARFVKEFLAVIEQQAQALREEDGIAGVPAPAAPGLTQPEKGCAA